MHHVDQNPISHIVHRAMPPTNQWVHKELFNLKTFNSSVLSPDLLSQSWLQPNPLTADHTAHRISRIKNTLWPRFFVSYGSHLYLLMVFSTFYFTSKSFTLSSPELSPQWFEVIVSYYRPVITSQKWGLKWIYGSTVLRKHPFQLNQFYKYMKSIEATRKIF